ncbi:hypothetical protein EB796_019300 [Bugula neritina]|uniref:SCOC n=1 Tax=Bugula neritina TaxID=10212 RepID=A0A7J7J838_BUGNE|nr:hypothetical protein EB796_019300 [Bugula neritina]
MSADMNTASDHQGAEAVSDEDVMQERQRLISQILDLQNTLDALSSKVDNVKEENLKMKSENQVLGQYIENLMSASTVFQNTDIGPSQSH